MLVPICQADSGNDLHIGNSSNLSLDPEAGLAQDLPALALVSMNITPFSCSKAFEPHPTEAPWPSPHLPRWILAVYPADQSCFPPR